MGNITRQASLARIRSIEAFKHRRTQQCRAYIVKDLLRAQMRATTENAIKHEPIALISTHLHWREVGGTPLCRFHAIIKEGLNRDDMCIIVCRLQSIYIYSHSQRKKHVSHLSTWVQQKEKSVPRTICAGVRWNLVETAAPFLSSPNTNSKSFLPLVTASCSSVNPSAEISASP